MLCWVLEKVRLGYVVQVGFDRYKWIPCFLEVITYCMYLPPKNLTAVGLNYSKKKKKKKKLCQHVILPAEMGTCTAQELWRADGSTPSCSCFDEGRPPTANIRWLAAVDCWGEYYYGALCRVELLCWPIVASVTQHEHAIHMLISTTAQSATYEPSKHICFSYKRLWLQYYHYLTFYSISKDSTHHAVLVHLKMYIFLVTYLSDFELKTKNKHGKGEKGFFFMTYHIMFECFGRL